MSDFIDEYPVKRRQSPSAALRDSGDKRVAEQRETSAEQTLLDRYPDLRARAAQAVGGDDVLDDLLIWLATEVEEHTRSIIQRRLDDPRWFIGAAQDLWRRREAARRNERNLQDDIT